MKVNTEWFTHDADRAALKALEAIPGFSAFVKVYMSMWNEQQFKILNMSSRVRLGKDQLPKYYNMLPPICEKLGIPVPELYLELNVNANAYTYGDTDPFIVITSGLLETLPDELIPTVLAHECGHIACHHTLYHTMGAMIVNGAASLPGLAALITLPLQIAFYYWMRCSEYSADRCAVVCDGSPDKMMEVCMRLAGYDKDVHDKASIDSFLAQAKDYMELVNDTAFNKTLEFLILKDADHPFTVMRAYNSKLWGESRKCRLIISGELDEDVALPAEEPIKALPAEPDPHVYLPDDLHSYLGMAYEESVLLLQAMGFVDVRFVATYDHGSKTKPGATTKITINGESDAEKGSCYMNTAEVIVYWYHGEDKQPEEKAPAARRSFFQKR